MDRTHDAGGDGGPGGDGGSKLVGAGVTGLLVLGVVAVVSIPLVLGLLAAGLLPGVGELRTSGGAWRLAHLLWIFPSFVAVSGFVVDPLLAVVGRGWSRTTVAVVETLLAWGVLTAMMGVFFVHPVGAALAAGVGLALLAPFTRLLERTADEAERSERDAEGDDLPA